MREPPAAPFILRPGVTLYFVRHGETDWNREARYQGQRDIPLNDAGRAQAKRNGQALKALSDQIATLDFVSSPLSRAVETMRILRSELGLPPDEFRTDDELRELHYGHWEGQLAADLATTDAASVAEKARDPYRWRPRGGESYEDLQARVSRWLAGVEHDAVVVSHGGVSRVARGAILGADPKDTPFLEAPQDRILVLNSDGVRWL
ncbi:MAG: histidine phosphatase family protein [Hyphomicrobium sp.]